MPFERHILGGMDRFFSRHLQMGLLLAGTILTAGCNSDPVVWPVSGEAAGDWTNLMSTYGPRIREEDGSYEFSRGIDIAVPKYSDVHAIAAGTVQLIEQITDEGGMRVQIAHDGYFSTYMNLDSVDAEVGDLVDPGDTIATSGANKDEVEQLHFEIRQPGSEKVDCVHPFRVLPYFDRGAPTLVLDSVDMTSPLAPRVTAHVVVRNREIDLVRISAATFEAPREAILDGMSPTSEQTWDMEEWNREKMATGDLASLNDPMPKSIEVHPEPFDNVSTEQKISFVFTNLKGSLDTSLLRLRLEAEDVRGNVAVVFGP